MSRSSFIILVAILTGLIIYLARKQKDGKRSSHEGGSTDIDDGGGGDGGE